MRASKQAWERHVIILSICTFCAVCSPDAAATSRQKRNVDDEKLNFHTFVYSLLQCVLALGKTRRLPWFSVDKGRTQSIMSTSVEVPLASISDVIRPGIKKTCIPLRHKWPTQIPLGHHLASFFANSHINSNCGQFSSCYASWKW